MTTFSALSSLVIWWIAHPANAQSSQPSGDSIRLHLIGGRPDVDGVFLGGQGPFRFLVDTGAESNQLDARIAHKLGLVPTYQVEMVTATGITHVPGAILPELSLGSVTAAHQHFLFGNLEGIHQLSSSIQGVLGQQFLERFDYLLDFASRRLVFGVPSPEGGSRLDFARVHGVPAIETSEGRLLLDSGTDSLVLFRDLATGSGAGTQLVTNSGLSSATILRNLRLTIQGKCYRASNAAVLPKSYGREGGLLPTSLFQPVYICNSKNYIVLNPDIASAEPLRRRGGPSSFRSYSADMLMSKNN